MTAASRAAAGLALSAALLLLLSVALAAPAQAASCRGADAGGGSAATRAAAMRCLVSQTRVAAGRRALRGVAALERSAAAKATSIRRCRSFTHTPCGRPMSTPMRQTGYARGCYSVGENLAWVTRGATPRQVLRSWLASPGHRANLLNARFRDTGVARSIVSLPGAGRVEVWVQHFGKRC
jgi:uncharacterized protein YkwD